MKSLRQQQILSLLRQNGYATVEQLSKTLYVSPPTIRRDLTELHKKRLISRSHGGAMLLSHPNVSVPIDFRTGFQTKAKAAVAKAASSLIQDGDVIFIDASTTTLHLLESIKDKKDLTIITNSAKAALILQGEHKLYATGGQLAVDSLAYFGSIAEQTVEKFNIDIMFFSSYGILENGEIQDYSEAESNLRNIAVRSAAKTVFLCDSEKIGRKSLFNVNNIQNIDYFVTNAVLPLDFPKPKKKIILCK